MQTTQHGRTSWNKKSDSQNRPLNNYQLFYVLERELYLREKGANASKKRPSNFEFAYYRDVAFEFPSPPPRYKGLVLQEDWFLKCDSPRRVHKNSQGVISLLDLPTTIASNWKTCDAEVKEYVSTIADIVKKKYDELKFDQFGYMDGMMMSKDDPSLNSSDFPSNTASVPQVKNLYAHESFSHLVSTNSEGKGAFNVSTVIGHSGSMNESASPYIPSLHQQPNCGSLSNSRGQMASLQTAIVDQHQESAIRAELNRIKRDVAAELMNTQALMTNMQPSYGLTAVPVSATATASVQPASYSYLAEEVNSCPRGEATSQRIGGAERFAHNMAEWAENFLEDCDHDDDENQELMTRNSESFASFECENSKKEIGMVDLTDDEIMKHFKTP